VVATNSGRAQENVELQIQVTERFIKLSSVEGWGIYLSQQS